MSARRSRMAIGGALLLVTLAFGAREPERAGLPSTTSVANETSAIESAVVRFDLDTPIGRVGVEAIRARDLGDDEQRALRRLLSRIDETKREALSRLEADALLALAPLQAGHDSRDEAAGEAAVDAADATRSAVAAEPIGESAMGEAASDEAEIDALLRSAPPVVTATSPPRELARHVLSLRARSAARSARLARLHATIGVERFVPPPEVEPAGPWPEVVARAGSRTITDADVESEAQLGLFWLRSELVARAAQAFASHADALLLAREAATRGMTPEALTAALGASAATPGDAAIDAELRRHGFAGDPRPERRARARALVAFRAADAARVDLLARLRAHTPVMLLLVQPTPPRVAVAESRRVPGDPPVTLIAFTNLRCRVCAATNAVLDAIAAGPYARRVRVVRRPLFPEAALPLLVDAVAEACAAEQGAGGALRRAVFSAGSGTGSSGASAAALGAVPDRDRFSRCMADPRTRATVEAQRAEAERLGFGEAPGFLVNGLPLRGFQGQARLESIIAAETSSPATPDAAPASSHRRVP